MTELFDHGGQPERTELAWRRTALALGVGSLLALRLLPLALGHVAWIAVGAGGAVASAALWLGARRRYRAVNRCLLEEGDHARMPGAIPLLLLALLVSVGGVLALAIVLVAGSGA